jgi:hypothetical protein
MGRAFWSTPLVAGAISAVLMIVWATFAQAQVNAAITAVNGAM